MKKIWLLSSLLYTMKILNDKYSDFHIHSSTFSDGLATIEEIVKFAGTIGLKKNCNY
jgi:hypothetical protein